MRIRRSDQEVPIKRYQSKAKRGETSRRIRGRERERETERWRKSDKDIKVS